MNPLYKYGAMLAALLAFIALTSFYIGQRDAGIYKNGFDAAEKHYKLREINTNLAHTQKVAEMQRKILSIQAQGEKERQAIADAANRENDLAQKTISALRTAVASGERKLFIATRPRPATTPHPASTDAGDNAFTCATCGETRAELDPQAALSLIGITDTGDQYARDFNELLGRYASLENQCRRYADTISSTAVTHE